ncbi:MAG TPA: acetate uptake transporter [Ktedonobacterales bacterium]|nr:acetate uptake transporter [Ktedonobacterales bacterium]
MADVKVPRAAVGETTTAVADPAPLGLSGFALTTFVLSIVNTGLLTGKADILVVIGLAVFYGGISQLLAGMWEFRNGNTFGATAFTTYGAFWLSYAALLIPGFGIGVGTAAGPSGSAVGTYLLAWTIITFLLLLGALPQTAALTAVFALLFLTFLFLTIGAYGNNTNITHIGGWLGILTAIVAWYTALAGILRSVSKGAIALPVYPMSWGSRGTAPA